MITEKKTLGFTNQDKNIEEDYERTKKEVLQELKKQFKPEFINRIDEIIVFHKLNTNEIKQIVNIILKQTIDRLKEKEIILDVDENVKDLIIANGIDSNYGARPLKRTIQEMIEDKIAEEIIEGNIKKGDNVKITEQEGKIIVEK